MIFKRGQAGVPVGITQRLLHGGDPERQSCLKSHREHSREFINAM